MMNKDLKRKGQGSGTIGVIFLFMIGILMVVFIVVMLSESGRFSTEINIEAEQRTDDVRRTAAISSVLNDHLWRADGISQGKYDNKLAKEIISYYFSTPGDTIYIGEEAIPKSEVRDDLENYLEDRMEEYFRLTSEPYFYWLRITDMDRESIQVERGDLDVGKSGASNFRVGLSDGEYATGSLVTRKSRPDVSAPDTGAPGPGAP